MINWRLMVQPWRTTLPPLRYKPSPNQSARTTHDVRLVVVHDPEGPYDAMVAYIQRRMAQVSYHVLLKEDASEATQFVPWSRKSWSVVAYNSYSDNISIAGRAGNNWSYRALNRLARVVAFRLRKRKLPAVFLSKEQIGQTVPPPRGFTFHSELGRLGGGHSDPGLTGPKKWFFISAVKWHYKVGKFRKTWGL